MDPQIRAALSHVINMVMGELNAAVIKHPFWPVEEVRRAAIVAEEAGELLQSALNLAEFRDQAPPMQTGTEFSARLTREYQLRIVMQKEAAQTAAMAIRYLLNHSNEAIVMNTDASQN